jgi:predicted aspartyl protease
MSRRAAAVARFAIVFSLLGVVGCANSSRTVCRTDIVLEERQRLLIAPIAVNGTPVRGILDTGAQASAVTDALVTRLGLLSDPRHGSLVSGVGGQGTAQNDALVDRLELAGFDPAAGHYPVIALPAGSGFDSRSDDPLGALIGADLLSHFDLDLDVAHDRLVLYDPDRCQEKLPNWREPMDEVPLDVIWTGRLQLTVTLDGKELHALLDSGATTSVLDLPAAERLGVSRDVLASEQGGEGFGAAGVNFQRVLHTFRTMDVGAERVTAPRLAVLDRGLRETDMLLGLDWLRTHHVFISFRRHTLFIARPPGVG